MSQLRLIPLLAVLVLPACDRAAPRTGAAREGENACAVTSRHRQREKPAETQATLPPLHERLSAAAALTSPEERDRELAAVAWDAIELDPEIAHAAFEKMSPDSPEKAQLIGQYAIWLTAQDPAQAVAWAEQLESPAHYTMAIGRIAVAMAEAQPRAAAELLTKAEVSGRELDIAVVEVTQRWAAQAPADAAAWIGLFPAGELRTAGLRIIAESWLSRDPSAAMAWLGAIEDASLQREVASVLQELQPGSQQ